MAARDSGIRVEGLRETVRSLERLGVDVADLKAAFGVISAEVVQKATALAPSRTGRLAASIRPAKTKNKAVVRAGSSAVPYAGVINYGWPARGIAPADFLTGPANATPDRWASLIDDELGALIRKHNLT